MKQDCPLICLLGLRSLLSDAVISTGSREPEKNEASSAKKWQFKLNLYVDHLNILIKIQIVLE